MITLQERVHGTPRPSSWSLGKLHRVLRLRKNFKNLGMQEDNLLSLSYGRIICKDIDTAEGLLPESFETYQIVEPGTIVMRLTDLQNDKRSLRQGLVLERGIITSAYDALDVGPDHDPRFWAYALLALDLAKYYYSLGGGVRQSINFADFPNDWISFPDRKTQEGIADSLDREATRINQLIEKKQRMVDLLEEKRGVIALQCLSEGLEGFYWYPDDQSVAFQFKQRGWIDMRIKSIVSFMTSGSRGWSNLLGSEGEIFIQSGNIGRQMDVDLHSAQRVHPQTGAEAERTLIKEEDVLVCITGGRTGAVGYVRSIKERAYINQHVCLLRARHNIILSELLAHILWSEIGQKQIELCQYGVKQGLGFSEVAEIKIPVPPREQQAKIITEIKTLTDRIDAATNIVRRSIDRLHEFRSALITAAVTGQIDITMWTKRGFTDRRLDAIEAEMTA
jgi:type I restriction enzyme, S subunit